MKTRPAVRRTLRYQPDERATGFPLPHAYTPIVLLALGALFFSIGALAGQETKEVDFQRQDVPGMA